MVRAQERDQGRPDPEADLAGFVHRWADAIVSNDVDRMAAFTTADWILIDQPGAISRETFHRVVANGQLRHEHMTHEVLGVDRHGPVVVVRTHGRNTSSFQGRLNTADEWTTNLLVETPDGWRCAMTQLTPTNASTPEEPDVGA